MSKDAKEKKEKEVALAVKVSPVKSRPKKNPAHTDNNVFYTNRAARRAEDKRLRQQDAARVERIKQARVDAHNKGAIVRVKNRVAKAKARKAEQEKAKKRALLVRASKGN